MNDLPRQRLATPHLAQATVVREPAHAPRMAVVVLATLALVYMLHWARGFFVPLMLAIILSYALSPFVDLLAKLRLPRAMSAAVLLAAIMGGIGALVYELRDEATELAETLPRATKQLSETLRAHRSASTGALEGVHEAAEQLERAAAEAVGPEPPPARGVTRVQVVEPGFSMQSLVRNGSRGVIMLVGQGLMVVFLTFFLLANGDTFRRKLISISGPTLSRKKLTLRALDDITYNIQRYLLVQVTTSVLVGVATWLAFLWIGLRNAGIWGLAAGVFNTVPYVGPLLVTAGSTIVGIVQFGTVGMGLLAGGIALVITGLEGYLLTPWLTGRVGRMNSVVVFVSLAFWGWLWGAWGLVLGVPVVMMIKAFCDRIDDLAPVSELLSD